MPTWMPDGSPTRARIGVLTPHLDGVPESEFQVLAPAGVSIHAARVPLGMIGPDGKVIPYVDAAVARAFAEPPRRLTMPPPCCLRQSPTQSSLPLPAAVTSPARKQMTPCAGGWKTVAGTSRS